MYEWGDIRVFLAVADKGSTLGAAKILGMNQTTVARRIQALERALGLELFDRNTRGHSLTAMGRSLIANAEAMLEAATDIEKRAAKLKRTGDGLIRISAATDSAEHWVIPVITAYSAKHPGVHFEVADTNRQVDLEKGDAEIAFRAADAVEGDTLVVRKLGKVPWAVYCGKSYVREFGLPRSFDEIAGRSVLSYTPNLVQKLQVLRHFESRIDTDKIAATYKSPSSVASSLAHGSSVGCLPMVIGEAKPELVFCFDDPAMHNWLWLVASKEAYEWPVIRDFLKFTGYFGLRDGLTLK